jgi:formate hydrogenlyase transcriptional activator
LDVSTQPAVDLTQSHFRALLDVSQSIVSHRDLRSVFQEVSRSLRTLIPAEAIGMALFDHEQQLVRIFSIETQMHVDISPGQTLPIDATPASMMIRTGLPFYVPNVELENRFPAVTEVIRRQGLNAFCMVPLITARGAVGGMNFASRKIDPFNATDLEMMRQVARQVAIAVENALAWQQIEQLNSRLSGEKLYLEDELRTQFQFEEIIGQSRVLREVLRQVETVAHSDSTVLICGETGTGKELIARAVHDLSRRKERTFVKLNCAAIPSGLLESEMFGHEKGAFTGAIAQRIGRFELAHGGTLFLDEVGEIQLDLQPKLLRVLQEREFERLGSARTQHVDVRLVAASNRDLKQMVLDRQFRDDLYYRLNVFPITIPPLRDRPEDVPLLVSYFTQQCARRARKRITTIPSETMQTLTRYAWPGNVRELQNLIERAVILSTGEVLRVPLGELRAKPSNNVRSTQTLEDAERDHIMRILQEANWVVAGANGAAARLGMKRSTLQFRMSKLGISRPK